MKPTVLLVEDDESLLNAYGWALGHDGFNVLLAKNAEEGLKLAKEHNPQVIVLDMLMPSLSGLDFLASFDIKGAHPQTKTIVFSNMTAPSTMEKAKALGATMYLTKAEYTPRQVTALIHQLLG